jgi:hypothetical protein
VTVKSIEKLVFSLAGGVETGTVALSKGQTIANCVPRWSVAYNTMSGGLPRVSVDVEFTSGPDSCDIEVMYAGTTNKPGVLDVIVYVVEFGAGTKVQSGTYDIGTAEDDPQTIDAVVLANSFAIVTAQSDPGNNPRTTWVRCLFNSTTQLEIERWGASSVLCKGHWYVVESLDFGFTTQVVSINGDVTDTISSIDTAKTFIIGSGNPVGNADRNADRRVYVELTNATTVTATAVNTATTFEFRGWAVTFAATGNGTVQRGTEFFAASDVQESATITAVDLDVSMPHQPDTTGGNFSGSGTANNTWMRGLTTKDLTSSTNIQLDSAFSNSDTFTAGWEVIEWHRPPDAVSIGRWLLDEASSGTSPTTAFDDEGSNDLTNDYGTSDMEYTSNAQGNGQDYLNTTGAGITVLSDMSDAGSIGGQLDGDTEASVIVVCNISDSNAAASRVIALGSDGGNTEIGLAITSNQIELRWGFESGGGWNIYNHTAGTGNEVYGLHTFHLIWDSTEAVQNRRASLYIDNVFYDDYKFNTIPLNEALDTQQSNLSWSIGNRPNQTREIQAEIFYVEIFKGKLTSQQRQDSFDALAIDHDSNWAAVADEDVGALFFSGDL